ncbi:hypothetical protein BHE74_00042659 [Ensete ventricosum]|nr:hypothetical protein GW17_00017047 [Ensete ventricosum]RWW51031.1 hypothetical protein BHE74_00042659 [Ensete ventricosum]RZS11124.1 hypothetical protein BHM03_00042423 [Ensete ventricosum]
MKAHACTNWAGRSIPFRGLPLTRFSFRVLGMAREFNPNRRPKRSPSRRDCAWSRRIPQDRGGFQQRAGGAGGPADKHIPGDLGSLGLGPVLPVSANIAVGNPRIATSGYKTTLCSCFNTAEGCQFGNFSFCSQGE